MFSHIFSKPLDVLSIGDITTDAFIRLKEASVHCNIDMKACELCMKFGDKVPFEAVYVLKGVGNSANAAVATARLGLRSALISTVGYDRNGDGCIAEMKKNGVSTTYITKQKNKKTNFHYVLWYESDRTILVNHQEYDYHLPSFPAPKWIYLSSIGGNSLPYHLEIIEYLKHHPEVHLAFQPGTFQMKLGVAKLAPLYEHSNVFVVNVEEAQRILSRPETGFSSIEDVKTMMRDIRAFGPKIVLVTDGPKGAYMYDGDHSYFMPIYPDPKPPLERTGCGDAFAATFVAALAKGHTPLEALVWAPINPMSVVQHIGAQEGLIGQGELETLLKRAPAHYHPQEI